MPYPLDSGTYKLNGRTYRNTGFRTSEKPILQTFHDTPDVYEMEDEPSEGCFAPQSGKKRDDTREKSVSTKEVAIKDNTTSGGKTGRNVRETSGEAEDTEDPRIKVVNGNKWVASVLIPQAFMAKFIGRNRQSLATLEGDTLCRIKSPRRDENKPCEITSLMGIEPVQRCLDRIDIFLADARKSARVTHFVAFPCNDSEVGYNFEIFKETILNGENYDDTCKNPKLFTPANRLHLTLAVGWVFDDEDMSRIKSTFDCIEQEVKKITGSTRLIVDIQGVDMMNDNPSDIKVLFAKVKGEKVQEVANLVQRRVIESGIGQPTGSDDDVKLHMTLMNGRYVAQAQNLRSYSFDGSQILGGELKDFYFGTIPIKEIVLCPLNSNTPSDRFYEKVMTINLE